MADIKIAVTRFTSLNTAGDQDITISGFGTPKAVLFILSNSTANDTASFVALPSYGATDGTNQWAAVGINRNARASTDNRRVFLTDRCISHPLETGLLLIEAYFNSWITDGIRITWSNAIYSELITAVFFGGADLNVKVDSISLGNTTSAQTYSSMGFNADIVFACGVSATTSRGVLDDYILWHGLIKNDGGSITQVCQCQAEDDNLADSAPVARMMNDKFGAKLNVSDGSVAHEYSASNFTSSGFDFTTSSAAGNEYFHILGLSLGGAESSVGVYNPPTTATTSTISSSFTPQFCLIGLNACASVDTAEQDGEAGPYGLSALDATNQYSSIVTIADASATTNTKSRSTDKAVKLINHDNTATLDEASLSSFNSSGTNLSFSTASGSTRQWIYLMIEEATAGGGGVPIVYNWGIFDTFIQTKSRSIIKGMKCQNI